VLADVFARAHRLLGHPTWFLTGTDEHGEKALLSAEARGIPVQQLCDEYSAVFRDAFARYGIGFDDFIRTTEPRHKVVATRVLEKLHAQGDLYKADYEGWYCTRCESFFNDTDVAAASGPLAREGADPRASRGSNGDSAERGGVCPEQPVLHGKIQKLRESNWFFRMSKYVPEVLRRFEAGEVRIVPERRGNEILALLKAPVQDLCISRSRARMSWGVPLPFDPEFICYVWIDALFNYRSAMGYLADDAAARERDRLWWPSVTHMMAKEIVRHHSVIWWTLLAAVGEPLPRRMYVHGWLLDGSGLKVSKTKAAGADAVVIAPEDQVPTAFGLVDALGADVARWAIATAMRPGDDGLLSWKLVRERVNAELANGVGNSVNRVVRMIHQFHGGKFPGLGAAGALGPRGDDVRARAAAVLDSVRAIPEALDLFAVTTAVRDCVTAISLLLDDEKPWKAAKDAANLPRVGAVLAECLEALRIVGLALTPFTPGKSALLRTTLGLPERIDFAAEARWGILSAGSPLGEPPNLFPRLDEKTVPPPQPVAP
jgi:methionyl-tRNA synthetase